MQLQNLLKLILIVLLFYHQSELYPQGVAVGTRFDLTTKLNLNSSSGQFAQLFKPDYYLTPQNGQYTLVFHLHSASWAAEDQVYRSNTNAILFNIHLGALSSPYQNYFTNQSKYSTIIDTINSVLQSNQIIQNPQIKKLIMTSFSAGYAGVREILKVNSYYNQIDALNLADGLHASSHMPSMITQMLDFVRFAENARNKQKIMLLTHSSIPTSGYQSTTQTANYLINEIGTVRITFSANDEIGTQYSRADTGYFHLKGYLGDTANDHLKHLYGMHLMLEYAVNLLDTMALEINTKSIQRKSFILYPNYPNPFNSTTTFNYYLPKNDYVTINIYNSLGQQIGDYFNEMQIAGSHKFTIYAHNLSSGLYFYKIGTPSDSQIGKMLVLK
jgi:hypothetical protein